MKVLINETKEVKTLSETITQFDDLCNNIVKVDNEEYDAIISLSDFNWWLDVEKGIEIAEERELDTLNFEYDDYINLVKPIVSEIEL